MSANASERASLFVKNIVNESLSIVNGSGTDEQKRQELSKCINKYLDIPRIAKSVFSPLGYNDLSVDDQKKAQDFLSGYLVRFYAGEGKLSMIVGAKLDSDPVATPKNDDFSVSTKFAKDASATTEIIWITDAKKVYYVEIEGINQIITLRAEMKAMVGDKPLMEYINAELGKKN